MEQNANRPYIDYDSMLPKEKELDIEMELQEMARLTQPTAIRVGDENPETQDHIIDIMAYLMNKQDLRAFEALPAQGGMIYVAHSSLESLKTGSEELPWIAFVDFILRRDGYYGLYDVIFGPDYRTA